MLVCKAEFVRGHVSAVVSAMCYQGLHRAGALALDLNIVKQQDKVAAESGMAAGHQQDNSKHRSQEHWPRRMLCTRTYVQIHAQMTLVHASHTRVKAGAEESEAHLTSHATLEQVPSLQKYWSELHGSTIWMVRTTLAFLLGMDRSNTMKLTVNTVPTGLEVLTAHRLIPCSVYL